MSNTRNLIDAIADGNALETESSFNAAIAEKIAASLDDMRQTVAQNMFRTPEAIVEEEFEYISEEEYLNLSEEEQQEYEQLDEISKELSNRYMNKVMTKAEKKSFPTKDSKKDLPSYIRKDIAHDNMHKTLGLKRKEGVTRASNRQISSYYDNHKGNAPAGSAAKKAERNVGADYREPGDNTPRNVGAVRKVK